MSGEKPQKRQRVGEESEQGHSYPERDREEYNEEGDQPHDSEMGRDEKNAESQDVEMAVRVFECKLEDTDHLIALLQAILIEKNQLVECQVSELGIKFQATKSKLLQAKAYIKRAMFSEFQIQREEEADEDETPEISFTVNLHILLQCLRIFGGSSHLQMSYAGYGAPVCLTLEDAGAVTQCEIVTLEPPASPDFNFRASGILNRITLKSKLLRDAFLELDVPGATFLNMRVSSKAPNFSLSVEGDSSNCTVDFPSEEQLFTQFEVKEDTSTTYSLNVIRPCMRALAKADHSNLRWNSTGMLSMQHSILTPDGNSASWVEFLMVAQDHNDSSQPSSTDLSGTTESDRE
eukprot:g60195.t1